MKKTKVWSRAKLEHRIWIPFMMGLGLKFWQMGLSGIEKKNFISIVQMKFDIKLSLFTVFHMFRLKIL
jgi:hypothetical protein